MKNSCNVYNAIIVEFEGPLSIAFQEFHIKNFNEMPCYRGGSSGPDYCVKYFMTESLPKIEEFCKNNNVELNKK